MNVSRTISNTVNGRFMRNMIAKKGWTKREAKNMVIEFLTCGKNISLYNFMLAK